jgi:hypothetical protein
MSDAPDPYAPTPYAEANAILLAGMVLAGDINAEDALAAVLDDMLPGELQSLADAARELHHQARELHGEKLSVAAKQERIENRGRRRE